ncbi:hypothetical protein [Aliikangiella sp. IMCC44359]|uniref:hypothetical protein n=1 Tax=Aliikangiella sp. IMCC44359 TaxID=3459125 RepID=UPI00403AE312
MLTTVIRKEHKNDWEKRTALIPSDVAELVEKGYPISIEPSDIRIYSDSAYQSLNIPIDGCPRNGQFIVGIKEPPVNSIQPGQMHLAFSHTMKGQDYNMGLLQKFIDQKATLIDYEPIVDDQGKRQIAFGRFAGIAGTIDSFFVAGKKLAARNQSSCLSQVKQAWQYGAVEVAKEHFNCIDTSQGEPIRVLIVGSGNVGRGSEEVCQWLGLPKIDIQNLKEGHTPKGSWYTVAKSADINQRIDGQAFSMSDFIKNGKKAYKSTFDQLLGKFDILLQTPYWTEEYPKHLSQSRMLANIDKLPIVACDISCDINGSLECTTKLSDVSSPAFTYNVETATSTDGILPDGITVIAIDNLPCELALDASQHFSTLLKDYLINLMSVNLSKPYEECGFLPEIARAVIVYNGQLTPQFKYLQPFLDEHNANQ